jgi:putative heme-binding domain-containing protein
MALLQAVDNLNVVFGEGQAVDRLLAIAKDAAADPASRNRAIEALAQGKTPGFDSTLLDFLGDRVVHRAALQGLIHFDTPQTPQRALAQLWIYGPEARQDLIRLLSSRQEYARALLLALEQGQIQVAEVSAFTARQIASFEDQQLSEQLKRLWGDVRPAAAEKKQQIGTLREQLAPGLLAQADLRQGRAVFKKACANCHVLYGEGAKIGPDLTGANRQNLDYLLENIVDPSASVGNEFRTTVFALDDGRVVSGVVANQSARTLAIQTPDGLITIDRLSIEQATQTATSLMPEALLQTLTAAEVRDLFAYLMSRNPVVANE